jgi:hypothetical protein
MCRVNLSSGNTADKIAIKYAPSIAKVKPMAEIYFWVMTQWLAMGRKRKAIKVKSSRSLAFDRICRKTITGHYKTKTIGAIR